LRNDPDSEVRAAAESALGRPDPNAPSEADARTIKGLIAKLAAFDGHDAISSFDVTRDGFAPIVPSEQFRTVSDEDHVLKKNAAFTSLVQLGPKAMPFLLESLDDNSPTKLVIGLDWGMWNGHEIYGNPFNLREAAVLPRLGAAPDFFDEPGLDAERYRVKVGDICFMAIGQITNRPYNAARFLQYGVVINSPVQDKELAADVRAIWGRTDYRRKLLESLLTDFDGRGPSEHALDLGAATRLAYYFPELTEDAILHRLKDLEPSTLKASKGWYPWHDYFIRAISFSQQPKIREELLRVFGKTKDPQALLAALGGGLGTDMAS
jgi:hypothetical protein